MKKLLMMAALVMAAVSVKAQSDPTPVDAYFTTKEMPDMLKWCPAPPDTIGPAFAFDIMQYMWGKQMRNCKERADIAIRDAVYGLDCSAPIQRSITCVSAPSCVSMSRH